MGSKTPLKSPVQAQKRIFGLFWVFKGDLRSLSQPFGLLASTWGLSGFLKSVTAFGVGLLWVSSPHNDPSKWSAVHGIFRLEQRYFLRTLLGGFRALWALPHGLALSWEPFAIEKMNSKNDPKTCVKSLLQFHMNSKIHVIWIWRPSFVVNMRAGLTEVGKWSIKPSLRTKNKCRCLPESHFWFYCAKIHF